YLAYRVIGQDIVAGQDVTFHFPHFWNICGGPWPCDRHVDALTRQNLIDLLGLTVTPGAIGHISIGGWQDNTDYPVRGLAQEPIVIVPGIMGSRLNRVSDGEEVWPDVAKMLLSGSDDYLDELKLNDKGNQFIDKQMEAGDIIDSAGGTTFYAHLLNAFTDAGYSFGTDLFVVPYDWRFHIGTSSAQFLAPIIQTAIAKSPTGKINIVAHSMGGLLLKEYLAEATSTNFINKLILVGVPELGSPKSFKILNYGDRIGVPLGFLNESKVRDISQNMPAVYELLPSRTYFTATGGGNYVVDFRNVIDSITSYLDYDRTKLVMIENPSDRRNSSLLDLADTFHQSLDTVSFPAQNLYSVIGCQNPATIGTFVLRQDNEVDILAGDGDGTAPLVSAYRPDRNSTNY
ncbi:MAG: hypothetical protein AAB867_02350, partial [Patescibacteria group bacterium]